MEAIITIGVVLVLIAWAFGSGGESGKGGGGSLTRSDPFYAPSLTGNSN